MAAMRDLWRRIRLGLAAQSGRTPSVADLPCAVCGQPAQSWEYVTFRRAGGDVIEGRPVCEIHAQKDESVAG